MQHLRPKKWQLGLKSGRRNFHRLSKSILINYEYRLKASYIKYKNIPKNVQLNFFTACMAPKAIENDSIIIRYKVEEQ